jgi:hypothetical protein
MGIKAGYIRVSSARQRDKSDSPASQRKRLADAGCTLFFQDTVSGFKREQRRKAHEFQRLWRAIASGELEHLVATRLDRMARRDDIVLELAQHCETHGVAFSTLGSGAVDTSTASGWLNVKVQLMFAEHFSRQLSENVKTGYQGLHAHGIPACPGSHIPFHLMREPGTRHGVVPSAAWDDARYVVDQLLSADWTLSDVIRYVWPRHKVLKTATSVRQWLTMPALEGHFVRNAGKPSEVVIRDCWPALITNLEAMQLADVLSRLRRTSISRSKGTTRALSSLCCCSACGSPMKIATMDGRRRVYLRCSTPVCPVPLVRVEVIETQLLALLGPQLKAMVEAAANSVTVTPPQAEVTDWRRELLARQAIPAEYRQVSDQSRIAELQELLQSAVSSQAGSVDQAELLRLRLSVESEAEWLARPEEDRNRDLRQLVDRLVVDAADRRITDVEWRFAAAGHQIDRVWP